MKLLTHRGININKSCLIESTKTAFIDQLQNGYGLEFDVQFTKDNEVLVLHDNDLNRISKGKDSRKINDMYLSDIDIEKYDIILLKDLINLIKKYQNKDTISALHLKGYLQDNIVYIKKLIDEVSLLNPNLLFLFDIKIKTATYIKSKNINIQLAPSVSHPFDIQRFNYSTYETLINIETAMEQRDLFDWVWLDEWDKQDTYGKEKELYSENTISKLKKNGFKIAIVSPELHATSPLLQSSEKHPDGIDLKALFLRLNKIIKLQPDLICTDYAEKINKHFKLQL